MTERKPFVTWTVKEVDYKLKLTTGEIVELESKLGCNLLKIIENDMPSLKIMIVLIHSALKKFNHGIKLEDVNNLIDDYFEGGGSQVELLTDVILPVFTVSGFFPTQISEQMNEGLTKAKEMFVK